MRKRSSALTLGLAALRTRVVLSAFTAAPLVAAFLVATFLAAFFFVLAAVAFFFTLDAFAGVFLRVEDFLLTDFLAPVVIALSHSGLAIRTPHVLG
ncbi:MAG: hypothetical protein AMJ69_07585 [Gammaproteobacteria bacterium SG8_47]|nr:MAG: hypothetical protein AMJ69_07585 [Gammaproteobacteria bacterium SG8_47]